MRAMMLGLLSLSLLMKAASQERGEDDGIIIICQLWHGTSATIPCKSLCGPVGGGSTRVLNLALLLAGIAPGDKYNEVYFLSHG